MTVFFLRIRLGNCETPVSTALLPDLPTCIMPGREDDYV